ncbi:tyrosine-type recombinase/integrase [Thiohalocapsa marina]|uniref:tyrosine-type recombinase/integrase n=1 Tax=Thiohalocapsa marina TaxID=424902 RepID=UPI0036DC372D
MSSEHRPISPLRQRMIEDMRLRKLSEKTQSGYLRWVKDLARFLKRAPDTATAEDLRRYQLHLSEHGTSRISLNAAVTALRFFFEITLGRGELMTAMSHVRVARTLPVVLSPEEVERLLDAAPGLKYKAMLSVAYGAGLRASEVVGLRVDDIDSQRMVIRVDQGKGRKDRYVMLSAALLGVLRAWWRAGKARGQMLPHGWLFPGQDPVNPLTTRQLNRACHAAAAAAGLSKRVSMHTLRHSFATHLLEHKEDIRVIQVLLGHKRLETTTLYTQVATRTLAQVTSPLERLTPKDPSRA